MLLRDEDLPVPDHLKAVLGMFQLLRQIKDGAAPETDECLVVRSHLLTGASPVLDNGLRHVLSGVEDHEGHDQRAPWLQMAEEAVHRFPGVRRLNQELEGARWHDNGAI